VNLDVSAGLQVGRLALDVSLRVEAGTVTAVLGPNAAGKTTLLRAIAGELAVERGWVRLGDRVFDEPPGTFVRPEHRRIGAVHQEGLLFPHLTALENVAFGPRSRRVPAATARRAAAQWLDRVGLGQQATSRPAALSGGQAQRVALARALASEPDLLLLDEPLSALDASTRAEVRRELRQHLAGFDGPTVVVTHDPVDALVLADHVTVVEAGRVVQAGTVAELAARPRSRYVAELIGTNLLEGRAAGAELVTADGTTVITSSGLHGPAYATVAPSAVALHLAEPQGSPRNRWRTTVEHLDLLGDRVRVQLGSPLGLVAEVTPAAVAELSLVEGAAVWASVKATEVSVYAG